MPPKKKQSIEIEKTHRNPLPSFHQAVTSNRQNFLGTALFLYDKDLVACPFWFPSLGYQQPGDQSAGSERIVGNPEDIHKRL